MAYKRRDRTFEQKIGARVDALKAVRKVMKTTGRQRVIHLFAACVKVLRAI
jgi:hypothetical protein